MSETVHPNDSASGILLPFIIHNNFRYHREYVIMRFIIIRFFIQIHRDFRIRNLFNHPAELFFRNPAIFKIFQIPDNMIIDLSLQILMICFKFFPIFIYKIIEPLTVRIFQTD